MPAHPTFQLDPGDERSLAGALYNHVWTLMETPDRDADGDDRMLHAAHASRHHWGVVGEARHRARGEWLCSRVYVLLGRGEAGALHHAQRCLAICEQHPGEDPRLGHSICPRSSGARAPAGRAG